MTAPIITAELVRRYLLAIDKPCDIGGVALYEAISKAWTRTAGCTRDEVIERLTLCAAADHLLDHVRFIHRNNPTMEPTDGAALIAAVLHVDAEELLKMAGISDPARWPPPATLAA